MASQSLQQCRLSPIWARQVQLTWGQQAPSKVSQNVIFNVRKFPATTQRHHKTYPAHAAVPPAWNQAGIQPGFTDTSTGKTEIVSKFKICSLSQTYTRKSHKNNIENIINRKQNKIWWIKTPNECSVLLSHKKHRAQERLRELPLPKCFSFNRENNFWRKILLL